MSVGLLRFWTEEVSVFAFSGVCLGKYKVFGESHSHVDDKIWGPNDKFDCKTTSAAKHKSRLQTQVLPAKRQVWAAKRQVLNAKRQIWSTKRQILNPKACTAENIVIEKAHNSDINIHDAQQLCTITEL